MHNYFMPVRVHMAPTSRTHKAITRKPEHAAISLLKVVLAIASLVLLIVMARGYHATCGNGWFMAIFKSLGVSCLAGMFMCGIAMPLVYWDISSKSRGAPSTVAGTVARALSPTTLVGMSVQIGLTYALYRYLTSDCAVQNGLSLDTNDFISEPA